MRLYVALWGKGSLKVGQSISGCLCAWIIFCQSRRFAAYHEQGQAPAPRRSSTICSFILPKLKGSLKTIRYSFSGCLICVVLWGKCSCAHNAKLIFLV
ncbi:hypothetical protein [Kingella oralis]